MHMNFRSLLPLLCGAILAACGGGASQPPQQLAALEQSQVQGYWVPADSRNDEYEFYGAADAAPYIALKTGRVLRAGQIQYRFYWDMQGDGSIKLSKVGLDCEKRPVTLCPVKGVVSVVPGRDGAQGGTWQFAFDDNADGVAERSVSDTYQRAQLNVSNLPEGDFLMPRAEQFDLPLLGFRTGQQFALRMVVEGQPVALSMPLPDTPVREVRFAAGERTAVTTSSRFDISGGAARELPVKAWADNVVLSAGANNGFLLEYEIHRKVQLPNDVAPSAVQLGDYEKVEKRAAAFGRVDHFVHGPTINAGDKFYSFVIADFDPEWVAGGAGNELVFTSATEGSLSHTDLNHGKYSERRKFHWSQDKDGQVTMTFLNGMSVGMRFVKPNNGGYQVVFSIPHPSLGVFYVLHDLVADAAPVLAEKDVPGRYRFLTSDGVTLNDIVLHADKTVSGVVGGFWFLDANGDVVSYECIDLEGRPIASYPACLASFDDVSKVSFAHIRRLRFMHRDGNDFQVKYDADAYGARFGIVGRDYFTFAWTYRFTRIGNE